MLSLLGYSVWIQVEGVELPQFDTKIDDAQRVATCWIPSQAGKNFVVCIKKDRLECDAKATLIFDGSVAREAVLQLNWHADVHKLGTTTVGNATRPFRFSAITPTDDEAYADQGLPKELGTLSIKIRRVRAGRTSMLQQVGQPSSAPEPVSHTIMHEKSKKAGAHCVSYGDVLPCRPTFCSTLPYDPADPKPFVTFTFMYRPKEFLQANEIMPRPVTQRKRKLSEGVHEAGSDVETAEDKRAMAQVQELRAKIESIEQGVAQKKSQRKQVKTELLDVIDLTDKSRKKAKREPSSHFNDGEVIDLT